MIQYKDLDMINTNEALQILLVNPSGFIETYKNNIISKKPAVFYPTNRGPEVLDVDAVDTRDLIEILACSQLYTQKKEQ